MECIWYAVFVKPSPGLHSKTWIALQGVRALLVSSCGTPIRL